MLLDFFVLQYRDISNWVHEVKMRRIIRHLIFSSVFSTIILCAIFTSTYAEEKLPEIPVNKATAYISKTYGIPLINGYLILPSLFSIDSSPITPNSSEIHRRWSKFLTINTYLGKNANFNDSVDLTNFLLTSRQKQSILSRYDKSALVDSYMYREFMLSLNESAKAQFHDYVKNNYSQQLGHFINGTISIMILNKFNVGSYNPKTSTLDVSHLGGSFKANREKNVNQLEVFQTPSAVKGPELSKTSITPQFETPLIEWSKKIHIPENRSEEILNKLKSATNTSVFGNSYAYNALFGTVVISKNRFFFSPEEIIITYDPQLKDQVVPITLKDVAKNEESTGTFKNKSSYTPPFKVDFTKRNFDIFGVKLGDDASVAKKLVERAFSSYKIELTQFSGTTEKTSIFVPAFEINVKYINGIDDTVTFYKSNAPKYLNKIVGLKRSLKNTKGKVSLLKSLIKKYGEPTIKLANDSIFFLTTPDLHNYIHNSDELKQNCLSGNSWPISNTKFNLSNFIIACGKIVGVYKSQMFMVDTNYIVEIKKTEPLNIP